MKKATHRTLCGIIIAVLCLGLVSCSQPKAKKGLWENAAYTEDTELGQGSKTLYVEVQAEDKAVTFTVHTDKDTVGEALLEHELIAGEQGPYGLYVKVVNGITADYNIDQSYWSFCKNTEAMMTGVDGEVFSDGARYELVYTK